jgi:rare lipoprotein A (peptidoglycan hydrolase)
MERSLRLEKTNDEHTLSSSATLLGAGVIACLVLLMAAVIFVVGIRTGSASAAQGGVGIATKTSPAPQPAQGTRFGARTLREGMSGPDVRILKGIVRSKRLLTGRLDPQFDRPTTSAVRRFQRSASIGLSGVVNKRTARALIGSLRMSEASWYGPGLYGNGTACGKVTLRPRTIGIAHKRLPCGTRVLIGYRGKFVIAPVIDRGPYIAGRTWDLTKAASDAIGMTSAGIARVRHAILSRGK